MVIVMRADAPSKEVEIIRARIENADRKISIIKGKDYYVLFTIYKSRNIFRTM